MVHFMEIPVLDAFNAKMGKNDVLLLLLRERLERQGWHDVESMGLDLSF